jgi:hypothetical protein
MAGFTEAKGQVARQRGQRQPRSGSGVAEIVAHQAQLRVARGGENEAVEELGEGVHHSPSSS